MVNRVGETPPRPGTSDSPSSPAAAQSGRSRDGTFRNRAGHKKERAVTFLVPARRPAEKAGLEDEARRGRVEAASQVEAAAAVDDDAARDLLLAAAADAAAREAVARKRLALPGYDPNLVIRGEGGICVGVLAPRG